MTPAQRKEWVKLLRTLETELVGKGATDVEGLRKEGDGKKDDDAGPLVDMLQTIASNRNANQAQLLERVRHALSKDPDDAGVCEECGEDVAWGRLKAVPFSEYCVACQAQKDGPRGPLTRRKLTDYR